jgi:hypothetical protein
MADKEKLWAVTHSSRHALRLGVTKIAERGLLSYHHQKEREKLGECEGPEVQ